MCNDQWLKVKNYRSEQREKSELIIQKTQGIIFICKRYSKTILKVWKSLSAIETYLL